MIIRDIDDAVGDMTVTFSGVVDTDQNVNISITEDTDSETLTVNFDGATTIDDATIIDANDANVTGSINVKVSAAGIFTGGVDLGGGTDSGDGTATITFDGGSAQAIAGAIDGLAANTGNVAVTNTAGAVTFAGAIGATNAVKTVTVGTSTDEAAAVFNAAVSAQTITVQAGDATSDEDSSIKFDAAVTGALVLAPSGGTATVEFVDDNAITALTGAITTTSTDGDDSFVKIYDDGGGAPDVQTFTAAIGTSDNKIGTLSIGGDSTDGGSGNFNGAVVVTNLTITSGSESNETSLGAFGDDVTATTITLDDVSTALTATLELDTTAAKTLAGTVDGAAAGEGILKVSAATKTISGVVGGINTIKTVDIDAAAVFSSAVSAVGMDVANGIGVTYNDDLTIGATKTTLNDATAEIIFSGTGNQTVTGEIIGGSAETGVIDVANTAGTVTFATALGGTELKEVELDASSTSVFSKTVKAALLMLMVT
jgi:hypothetical protein